MSDVPFHPAIVHVPLGLAVVMPVLLGAVLLAYARGWLPRGAWAIPLAGQVLVLLGGIAAARTGEGDEDRVEAVLAKSLIEQHEHAAQAFMAAAVVTALLCGLALLVRREAVARGAGLAALVASVLVAGLGLRAGKMGGELVYVHGAASAFRAPATGAAREREDH